MSCPFCTIQNPLLENENGWVRYDNFPVTPGHVLVISKSHCSDFFDLNEAEQGGLLSLLNEARFLIIKKYSPDSFNVGINCGKAAGQTIGHCHIHLIPRYLGDVVDPTGGVRGVIPSKQRY